MNLLPEVVLWAVPAVLLSLGLLLTLACALVFRDDPHPQARGRMLSTREASALGMARTGYRPR
jgi:hypothetical protein